VLSGEPDLQVVVHVDGRRAVSTEYRSRSRDAGQDTNRMKLE